MITIMGASGNVGKGIAERLLAAGEKVRALGRSASKLQGLKDKGAEVLTGDVRDTAFLAGALRGANAAFTLIPPDPHSPDFRKQQDAEGESIAQAVAASGVPYLVFLSSIGADQESGTGPIAGLHAQEERLRLLSEVNVLALRPTYFFENFYATLGLIRHQGINGGAIAPDVPFPMIATRDIADAAAAALRARGWKGFVVRELLGPRDLTMAEATQILGSNIGKPELPYVQFPYADFAASLVGMGLSKSVADLYAEMAKGFNEGLIRSVEGRSPHNTTATRFEDFAKEFAVAYQVA